MVRLSILGLLVTVAACGSGAPDKPAKLQPTTLVEAPPVRLLNEAPAKVREAFDVFARDARIAGAYAAHLTTREGPPVIVGDETISFDRNPPADANWLAVCWGVKRKALIIIYRFFSEDGRGSSPVTIGKRIVR